MIRRAAALRRRKRNSAIALTVAFILAVYAAQTASAANGLSTAVVNSTGDDVDLIAGDGTCDTGNDLASGVAECTLRAAIAESNASALVDTIHFNIPTTNDPGYDPTTGIWEIAVPTALPDITADTDILAATQPGHNETPLIAFRDTGDVITALRFQGAPGGSVQDFAVYEFGDGDLNGAIEVVDSNAVVVSDNFVGVAPNATGDTTVGNDAYGIRLIRSARTAVNNNVIGNNSLAGLDVTVSSTDTTVDGNFIGITGDDEPIPNGHGIVVYGSDRTIIGGIEGNTIALNDGHAIQLIAGSLDTEIYNNSLGVTSTNSVPPGPIQSFTGIMVRDMSTATIGDATRGNIIGSLDANGIQIDDATATIEGNLIGTNDAGADLGNTLDGIRVTSGATATIRDNVIGNNTGSGILLTDATGSDLVDNTIGTGGSYGDLGNGRHGIELLGANVDTRIEGNTIGFNLGNGVDVDGTSTNTQIDANLIGVSSGDDNIGNSLSAIFIGQATSNTAIAGNVLSFNRGGGIAHAGPSDADVINNIIGLTPDADAPAGNRLWGVASFAGANTLVEGNTIAANGSNDPTPNSGEESGEEGILLQNSTTIVRNNFIGTNAAGDAFGNFGEGIEVTSLNADATIENNVIANNGTDGITVVEGLARISQNSIFNNAELAIDLGADEVTLNDGGDVDTGPNNLLNFPDVLEPVQVNATQFEVPVELDVPTGNYRVEFYENATLDPSGFGEAETFIDSILVSSVGSPTVATLPATSLTGGNFLSALLYDQTTGATSELSNAVLIPNRRPIFDATVAAQTHPEGAPLGIQIFASDPDGDDIRFSAVGLPSGLSIDPISGLISGTPSFTTSTNAVEFNQLITVTVAETDFPALTNSMTFPLTITNVNRAPGLQAIASQTTDEGTPVSLGVSGSDPDGDSLNYTASGLPPGLEINFTTGEITGSPTIPGTYVVNITATDGIATTTTQFSWNIVGQPTPSTTTAPTTTIAPTTTTTPVARTTTTPVAPTTTPTTTAPTTPPEPVTTTTTQATTTTTTQATTTTTEAPSTTAPSAIPFVVDPPTAPTSTVAPTDPGVAPLRAADDAFVSSRVVKIVDLLENDLSGTNGRILSVTQPSLGEVRIVNDRLVEITLPGSFGGRINFTYDLIDDNGATSTASVSVESTNVLAFETAGQATSTAEESGLTETFSQAVQRTQQLGSSLLEVRLSSLEWSSLLIAPALLWGLFLVLRSGQRLVSITGLARSQALSSSYPVRFDQVVWATNNTRNGGAETQVMLRSGETTWVPTEHIVDTGF